MPRASANSDVTVIQPVKFVIPADRIPEAVKERAKTELRTVANQVRFEIGDKIGKASGEIVNEWLKGVNAPAK